MLRRKRFQGKQFSSSPSSNTSSLSNSEMTSFQNNISTNIIVYKKSENEYSLTNPKEQIYQYHYVNPNKNEYHPINYSLSFKNKNFVSKFRSHNEKTFRNAKNMKNLSKDIIDSLSYQIYNGIENGPSLLPHKKYCDYTGFETNYTELNTGIRYYDGQIFRLFQDMPQPLKDQYLNIRKALIRLK